MSYSPIAFTAPNYRDYGGYWLKAYEPGTTTPKYMSNDAEGTTLSSKYEVNSDGFFVSSGSTILTPYINDSYDLWLFPTETDANNNDTTNAVRIADGLGVNVSVPVIRYYDTKQDAVEDTSIVVGEMIETKTGEQYVVEPVDTGTGILYTNTNNNLQLRYVVKGNNLHSSAFGFTEDDDITAFINEGLQIVDTVHIDDNSRSDTIDVPAGKTINYHGHTLNKSGIFTPNEDKSYFRHVGDSSYILGVSCPNIAIDEFLISYQDGVNRCEEFGCSTGRGNGLLIKFQGVENTNVSRTLESQLMLGNTYGEKTMKVSVDAPASGVSKFKRARYFPSYCKIKSIKVTDTNGSPDFYFDLAMRDGAGFAYPFIRDRDTSDIDTPLSIDWIYDSSDDVLSFTVANFKATDTVIDIEIAYTNEMFASLSSVWAYQSELDFLRPHNFGSASRVEAIRSPEYRSYISGSGLDVRTATPSRNKDDNYNLPNVTMPTPAGTQDTSQSSEIKFYFRLSAGAALSAGATHALFRLYQSNRQIKCTVINGFLAQAPDWVSENHLAVAFQPDIEIDWPAQTDRDNPTELLIPLDKKMLQQASRQAEKNDFEYYYLTFYAHLPEHVAIEWADVWEWDFQFIKQ